MTILSLWVILYWGSDSPIPYWVSVSAVSLGDPVSSQGLAYSSVWSCIDSVTHLFLGVNLYWLSGSPIPWCELVLTQWLTYSLVWTCIDSVAHLFLWVILYWLSDSPIPLCELVLTQWLTHSSVWTFIDSVTHLFFSVNLYWLSDSPIPLKLDSVGLLVYNKLKRHLVQVFKRALNKRYQYSYQKNSLTHDNHSVKVCKKYIYISKQSNPW